ncbi:MAG: tagatose 1,6-diphosphate aldolase [Tissierellia bacterium]|nr:tagatose 1,6-diphosphate aldolase [Tissierellia bacterium]
MKISAKKYKHLEKLSNKDGVIAALAIDQRGSMRKMVAIDDPEKRDRTIKDFKKLVSKELTPYSSSILLDPIYGLEAIRTMDKDSGLILAYEVTGYRDAERLPLLLEQWSVHRLAEKGADGIKILLYYDVDDNDETNEKKKIFVERVGNECLGAEVPFFLEIITYDRNIEDSKSKEFAKVKPHKVNKAVKEFSKDKYHVDVLKLEVPVNMAYVEGYGEDPIYTKEEAAQYFKEQSEISSVPFIFLSAGVTAEMFQKTLCFAKDSGSTFNGVLCGRATWKDGVGEFVEDEKRGKKWLQTQGIENIQELNSVLETTATSWKVKFEC